MWFFYFFLFVRQGAHLDLWSDSAIFLKLLKSSSDMSTVAVIDRLVVLLPFPIMSGSGAVNPPPPFSLDKNIRTPRGSLIFHPPFSQKWSPFQIFDGHKLIVIFMCSFHKMLIHRFNIKLIHQSVTERLCSLHLHGAPSFHESCIS